MRRKDLKRLLSAFLAAGVIATSTVPVTIHNVYADSNYQYTIGSSTLSYTITDNDEIEIISYDGTDATLVIPDEIDGKKVTAIGYEAFKGCSGLTSITIPASVTSIGGWAFEGCSGLTSITIPDSVTTIEGYVFYGCRGLTSITIPDSVTSIGSSAFEGCSGLTSITIPDSVTSIEYSAFRGCSGLTSITIPDSVTFIRDGAFEGCSGLASINVDENNTAYQSEDGIILFDKQKTQLITCLPQKTGAYTIPDSVTSIGYAAFEGCSGLTSITIPDSVTSIGYSAFYGCSGLTSITIPDSVTSIGGHAFCHAFYGCSGLTSITIPASVTSIGESAFGYCRGLTSITIPASVTSIGSSAFYGCSGLTSITIPDSVTSIGYSAFEGCSGLTSITIPDSVTSIGYSAFYDCPNLVIYGNAGSYAEQYATDNNIPFIQICTKDPIAVSLTGNQASVTLGEKITFTAAATGGEEGYTYRFLIHDPSTDKWATLTKFTSNNTYNWKATKAGEREIYAEVKDASGKIVRSEAMNVICREALSVSLTAPATEVEKGSKLTISAQATGGSPEYTYRYSIVNKETGSKVNLTGFVKNSTYTWTPTKSGKRELCVEVKDASGKIVRSEAMNVICREALSVSLTAPATEVEKGSKLTISAQATGGSPEYTYRYSIVNKETGSKANLTGFVKNSTYVWTPTKSGKRELYVEVKDASGNIVKSNSLNIVCSEKTSEELSVSLTAPATEVAKGSKLTISAQATGGTSGYTYRYSIVNPETGRKANLTGFVKNSTYTWTPTKSGKRELCVEVKDSTDKVVKSSTVNVVVK